MCMLQLCRKSWAERKNAGELDFSVCRAALHSDAHLMRQAEDEYDLAYPGAKGDGKQGAEQDGAGRGAGIICYNCKKPGHKSPDCLESSYKKARGRY